MSVRRAKSPLYTVLYYSRLPRLAYLLRQLWRRLRRPLTVGVAALVVDERGWVLLVRHSYVAGWRLPTGGVAQGETASRAVARELEEELGLSVYEDPPRLLGLYAQLDIGGSDHVAVYVVEKWSGLPCPDGLEVIEAEFFAPEAPPPAIAPATRRRIEEFRGRAPVTATW